MRVNNLRSDIRESLSQSSLHRHHQSHSVAGRLFTGYNSRSLTLPGVCGIYHTHDSLFFSVHSQREVLLSLPLTSPPAGRSAHHLLLTSIHAATFFAAATLASSSAIFKVTRLVVLVHLHLQSLLACSLLLLIHPLFLASFQWNLGATDRRLYSRTNLPAPPTHIFSYCCFPLVGKMCFVVALFQGSCCR